MSNIRITPALRALTVLFAAALAGCGAGTGASPAATSTLSRPSAGGGADVLTRAQIERIHATSMEQLMTRRFNGVQVMKDRGELTLRVRGTGEPLIVLDGAPLATHAIFWGLDPSDIEQIRVLRDTETAIYGLQGGNGVILVTTRRQ